MKTYSIQYDASQYRIVPQQSFFQNAGGSEQIQLMENTWTEVYQNTILVFDILKIIHFVDI